MEKLYNDNNCTDINTYLFLFIYIESVIIMLVHLVKIILDFNDPD